MGAHSTSGDRGSQPADPGLCRDLVAEIAVLTAPDEEVYRADRQGLCGWRECPERSGARPFCRRHRLWRLARNQVKVRAVMMVRLVALELERQGYPVSAP